MSSNEVRLLDHFSLVVNVELKICSYVLGQVVSIQSDELILEAFKRMEDNHIVGLPVVKGPKRKIIGNASIRDIRYFFNPSFSPVLGKMKCKILL